MLLSLSIKDLVLIDNLQLSLDGALSVLTGETGAGKSILLDAVGLALGMRGDAALIRQGAEQAVVSAEFRVEEAPHIARLLDDHGIPHSEGASPLVFRRILSRTAGRSRAFVNDQPVSVGLLRLLGDALLEIHGQFDRLLDPASYRGVLDEFAHTQDLRKTAGQAFREWQKADQQWRETQTSLTALQQNEEYLKLQVADLKKLNPAAGEEETLLRERETLAHVGKLSEAIREGTRSLQAPSVETALHTAIKSLQRVQGQGDSKVDAALTALERAVGEVVEANAQIQEITEQLEDHPRRLQEIDERLYSLRAAARKYGVMSDGLAAFQESLAAQLSSLDQAADVLAAHARAAASARAVYHEAALELRRRRTEAAALLEQAVMGELPPLRLPDAQFSVQVAALEESQWGETGLDRIDFRVAMNKGQALCSLSKSASGGELARVMLAVKVALASQASLPTIIFDEIDTGVGGAVAAAIGERLAKLAAHVQVLAITHSPQVAACAHHHFLVYKEDQGAFMRTSVRTLTPPERQEELARMLAGAEVTVEAQAAARRLLGQGG